MRRPKGLVLPRELDVADFAGEFYTQKEAKVEGAPCAYCNAPRSGPGIGHIHDV
jgi:hypothetical protein